MKNTADDLFKGLQQNPPTKNKALIAWVKEMAELCQPERVVWCDGSEKEKEILTEIAVQKEGIERLDPKKMPGCLYGRSAINDVARVEHRTFICTKNEKDAGPTNNWMAPAEAYKKGKDIFRGSMKGRTLFVMPFLMGIPGSPFNKIVVQLTDSTYVVLNMRIMTTMGKVALDELGDSNDFTRGVHGKVEIEEENRYILHFPEDNTIWSMNTNYGGNVLLGKKCLALRIASWLGKTEGWLAEHMLILGIQNPKGEIHYVTAAFPSQCGKTNLAMLIPPDSMKGYKVWTVGDDIAWLRIGEDGRLWAVNPEAGFFGVAPGTNQKTNPNAMETIKKNTIFTNVLKKPDNTVWWEGHDEDPPAEGIDWKGNPWKAGSGENGAHPNSRFTAPCSQCPCASSEWRNPKGVPISAMIFGGRRAGVSPLVHEAFDWNHGVYMAATMTSETTAAKTGKVGVVRHDPMAMLPFCGYDMGQYFDHWIKLGKKIPKPPKIFRVNWFRKNKEGKFIWPGFGENLRVLEWIVERSTGVREAEKTSIGYLPKADDIPLKGTSITKDQLKNELLNIEKDEWIDETKNNLTLFEKLDKTLPAEIKKQRQDQLNRLA